MICISPITLRNEKSGGFDTVPCGKCGSCLLNKMNEWSFRLQQEAKAASDVIFLTLTYSEDFVPPDGVCKEHLQLYFKKLRRYVDFRYYLVSEYGPTTFRPHYHALIFFTDFDSSYIKNCEEITHKWQYGFVKIDVINTNRINYVAKYHVTKGFVPDGQNSNFCLMSRRPAIGACYLNPKNIEYHDNGGLGNFTVVNNSRYKQPLPRYYRDKIFTSEAKEHYRSFLNAKLSKKSVTDFYNDVQSKDNFNTKVKDKFIKKKNKL
nr:MAG: replication initiator protein [Microvirus sp.]